MSETTETEKGRKRRLGLSRPGRLELKKTVETGQVRQSFSHGRSKSVTVEVKKKRRYARGEGGRMTEVTRTAPSTAEAASPGDAAPKLTEEERAARQRALAGAVFEPAGEAPPPEVAEAPPIAEPEPVPVEPAEEEQPAETVAEAPAEVKPDAARRQQDEEARRLAKEEVGLKLKESKVKLRTPARPQPRAPEQPEPKGEAAEEGRRVRRGRGGERRPQTTLKRSEPRRRHKMTITEALVEDGSDRQRSLASVRRARERERQQAREALKEAKKVVRDVVIPETITVQELANRMAERGADVIKVLMNMGVMATITQSIDGDTAELVAGEFGHRVKRTAEADVELGIGGEPDAPESLRPRPPVVTVMGHVDHGKTSLLDALRETDVAAREAGGITQHIGAYQVTLSSGDQITFLDTPGHEAFTAMRARGASATDIVVLVVAADDGVQPQTVEAISHARAAEVPIVVAVNKVDRAESDPTRIRNELLQHEIVPEEMGGDIICIDVSALKKTNLDKLEEAILLQAEVLELMANPDRRALGVVVEAKIDRGRGSVATVLVQRGTLNVGDIIIAGGEWGKVRALVNDKGEQINSAGPSTPVEVLGLNGAPAAGDDFAVVESEGRAREITEFRLRQIKKSATPGTTPMAADIWTQIAKGEANELPIVIKADVQGSVEAIQSAAHDLGTDEVSVRVLHAGVGGINESDVALAKASNAVMIGFNVRANPQARELAQRDNIEIRYYSVIYEIIDDLKKLLSGMLAPAVKEVSLGSAEVREVFTISKVGKVAGCYITQGVVRRGTKVRLMRDDVIVHDGALSSLKRFKDEVKEVREGYECGIALENYQDIKIGDNIECYEVEETARSL
ncbi:MAG: translation initiation factor IF-2 [Alphaproteobacteria bacterium]|nr:translation initiation factor IF-2 [Alphaproteobacteria bacterium]